MIGPDFNRMDGCGTLFVRGNDNILATMLKFKTYSHSEILHGGNQNLIEISDNNEVPKTVQRDSTLVLR